MVDARLPDGSRVNAIIPPLGGAWFIADHPQVLREPFTVDDLIGFGSMTRPMAEFLEGCVQAKLNMLVSGGTGTGKTTLLNVLSSFIPPTSASSRSKMPSSSGCSRTTSSCWRAARPTSRVPGEVTIRDLVRNSLRMRPDRIVVGECRGGEALDMLQAMNTGHNGSISTIHANAPRDCIARLETLVLMAGMDLPLRAIREQVASAIDLIVQIQRLRDGSRRVTQVTEVIGMEGDTVVLQDAFIFDYQAGFGPDGHHNGVARATGLRPRFLDKFDEAGVPYDLALFDPEALSMLALGVSLVILALTALIYALYAPPVPLVAAIPARGARALSSRRPLELVVERIDADGRLRPASSRMESVSGRDARTWPGSGHRRRPSSRLSRRGPSWSSWSATSSAAWGSAC